MQLTENSGRQRPIGGSGGIGRPSTKILSFLVSTLGRNFSIIMEVS